MNIIGSSPAALDAVLKATGQLKYLDDRGGYYTVKAVRTDRRHAAIKSVDFHSIHKMEGILAVITASDIPGNPNFGVMRKDQPLLVRNSVKLYGEAIALIVGERFAAEAAVKQIKVEYDDLPVVLDMEQAIENSPIDINGNKNIFGRRVINKGDFDSIDPAGKLVVSNVYSTQSVDHGYIEPDVATGEMIDGRLVLTISGQYPHQIQRWVAELLNLPLEMIRVVQGPTGGGFGGKIESEVFLFTALACFVTNRPVKMAYTRREVLDCTVKRHPYKIWYTSIAERDGRLLGINVKILVDTGPYCTQGPAVAGRAAIHASGPYAIPHARVEAITVCTNNPNASAMRGYGCPQITFAIERQMDLLAQKAGISPIEIRLLNCLRPGDSTLTGQTLTHSVGIEKTLLAAKDLMLQAGHR